MASKTCLSSFVKTFLQSHSSSSIRICCGIKNVSTVARKDSNVYFKDVEFCSLLRNCHILSHLSSPVHHSYRCKSLQYSDKTSWGLGVCGIEELEDFVPLTNQELQTNVTQHINKSVELGEAGRLFAVVYIRGMQHKVTPGDIISVRLDFPPTAGDRLRLEKVLAVGGKDFTLFGQPMLGRDVVRVDATVVEKTLSHNRIWLVYQKRKNWQRFHLFREMHTNLVINSIQVGKLPVATSQEAIEDQRAH